MIFLLWRKLLEGVYGDLDKVLYTIRSIISSSASALTSSVLAVFSSRTILTILSAFSSLASTIITLLPAFGSFFLSSFPRFLGEEVALDVERCMIAGVLSLLSSGIFGEGYFEDGQETLLTNSHQSFFSWLIHINNFLLSYVDDLVQAFHLPSNYLSDPESLVHQLLSGLDGHEGFALSEEESECT